MVLCNIIFLTQHRYTYYIYIYIQTILWYMSKEVESTSDGGGEIHQVYSFWANLMGNAGSVDLGRYPCQTTNAEVAWQTLSNNNVTTPPTTTPLINPPTVEVMD
jgi:hypothetical protein